MYGFYKYSLYNYLNFLNKKLGKTETVKALGALFGRQVLVFNCDDGLNYKSVGRLFIGLVMSGVWGCFDEFNRLKEDQLSAIADQIQAIQYALKKKKKSLSMLQKTVPVNQHAAIFVTMNPAGKGYGGRSNLPSNLKALFRPIAMGYPDKTKIAEVALLSDGFLNAKKLGRKLVYVFSTAKNMLTSQRHYDWGLRSLKSIVRTAGTTRRRMWKEEITPEQTLKFEVSL
jgi:dynein heavy chain 2